MDIVLLIAGIICILVGLAGCILPVLPGPPLSYLGLLLLHWTHFAEYSTSSLTILAIAVIVVTLADNIFPVWMTKKMGGSSAGVWGATIGLVVGLIFFGPWGAIFLPFAGALLGEVLKGTENKKAFKAALGSFWGFFLGTGVKLITSGIITFYFFQGIFKNFSL